MIPLPPPAPAVMFRISPLPPPAALGPHQRVPGPARGVVSENGWRNTHIARI